MKSRIICTSILLSGIALLIYGALSFRTTSQLEFSLLSDITDTSISLPDTAEIFALFGLKDDKWKDITFRAQAITNYESNKVYTANLPARMAILANPEERNKEVNSFKLKYTDAILAINNSQFGRPKSNIYVPLVREMNRLGRTAAVKKICVLYSNCKENALFNVYRKEDSILLSAHPDQVIQKLLQIYRPTDLLGVTLYIVHESLSDKDDAEFTQMAWIFKQLLEQYGAKVIIGGNLVSDL